MFPAKKANFFYLDFGTWIYQVLVEKSMASFNVLLNVTVKLLTFTNSCAEHVLYKRRKLQSCD